MFFRQYLVTAIFIALLIWGPIEHSLKGWLIIRCGYLILIPLLIYLLLSWIWNRWKPNRKVEDVLERTLSGIICVSLLLIVLFEATAKEHIGNTKWIQTREGIEAVGDEIVLEGPDKGIIAMLVLISVIIFLLGVLKLRVKDKD
jgi:hypothetical protein